MTVLAEWVEMRTVCRADGLNSAASGTKYTT